MTRSLREAVEGIGPPIVLLHGEAGIGKTRILEEMLRRHGQPGAPTPLGGAILTTHCRDATRRLPFGPFADLLEQALRHTNPRLLDIPEPWLAELRSLLPSIAMARPGGEPPAAEGPRARQRRLFQAILILLRSLSEPWLASIEDLHWADEESLSLLDYLARQPELSGGWLVTVRAGDLLPEVEHQLRQLERDGLLLWTDVGPLTHPATRELVRAASGQDDRAVGEAIHRQSRGNPLYVVELARAYAEELREPSSAGKVAAAHAAPPGIAAVLRARMARLPPPCRVLLEALSIFPHGATLPLLVETAETSAASGAGAIGRLRSAAMIAERLDGTIEFHHEMLGRVVAADLGVHREVALNTLAYRALRAGVAVPPSYPLLEELAHHARAGELWAEAVDAFVEAAGAAERIAAFRAAAARLEDALDCLAHLLPSGARRRQALDIRLRLATLGPWFDPARQSRWLATALHDATELRDPAVLPHARMVAIASRVVRGNISRAAPLIARVVPLMRASGRRDLVARVLFYQGLADLLRADYVASNRALAEAENLLDEPTDDRMRAAARGLLITNLAAVGEFADAERGLRDLELLTRRHDDVVMTSSFLYVRSVVANLRGRWSEAAAACQQGIELARQGQHRLNEYLCSAGLGRALLRLGHADSALRALDRSIALARRARSDISVDWVHIARAETLLSLGDAAAAETTVQEALRLASASGFRRGHAYATMVWGEVAAAKGQPAVAVDRLAQAAHAMESLGIRPDLAVAHALISELSPDAAQRARHHRSAHRLFAALGMDWHLEQLVTPGGRVSFVPEQVAAAS